MQLVAINKNETTLFRSQSAAETEIEVIKQVMQGDCERELDFAIMSDEEFESWLTIF